MPVRPPADAQPESLRAARLIAAVAALVVLALLYAAFTSRAKSAQLLPAPTGASAAAAPGAQQASVVLAGGCFWGVQAVFQHTRGVLGAVSGYAGGAAEQANYPAVVSGNTGHAEAVRIRYDPQQITLGGLLQVFFSVAHDPTERDRQGPDMGPQYRSAVFFETDAQRDVAQAYIAQLDAAALLRAPIATKVEPLTSFYPAESGHQDYAAQNPSMLYIATYDAPK
ncbi:MAG: peptide-methionine (S)-S-oxide reductase MsrA, partial [Giesbergeria sp.]